MIHDNGFTRGDAQKRSVPGKVARFNYKKSTSQYMLTSYALIWAGAPKLDLICPELTWCDLTSSALTWDDATRLWLRHDSICLDSIWCDLTFTWFHLLWLERIQLDFDFDLIRSACHWILCPFFTSFDLCVVNYIDIRQLGEYLDNWSCTSQ